MNLPPEAPLIPQHLLDGASLLADRYALLPLLPKGAVFAEVGVGLGDFSELVLSVCQPSLFVAIDEFKLHELPELWGKPSDVLLGGRNHADAYRTRFATALAQGRLRLLEGDSAACLEQLEDHSLDIVYVDADHRYEQVKRDLAMAVRKVRADGWIIVNDYLMVAALGDAIPYGVVNATNEFMIEHDWGLQYFALHRLMFCDLALRPAHLVQSPQSRMQVLAAENARLHEEIALLRGSTSWRATEILRRAVSLARSARPQTPGATRPPR